MPAAVRLRSKSGVTSACWSPVGPARISPFIWLSSILQSCNEAPRVQGAVQSDFDARILPQVFTAGGGAANDVWTSMRATRLGVPVLPSPHMEAAYGTALLAMRGFQAHEINKDRPAQEQILPGLRGCWGPEGLWNSCAHMQASPRIYRSITCRQS